MRHVMKAQILSELVRAALVHCQVKVFEPVFKSRRVFLKRHEGAVESLTHSTRYLVIVRGYWGYSSGLLHPLVRACCVQTAWRGRHVSRSLALYVMGVVHGGLAPGVDTLGHILEEVRTVLRHWD